MVNDALFTKLRKMASGLDEEELRTVFACPTCGAWPLKVEEKTTTPLPDSFELSQLRSTNVPCGFQLSMTCRSSEYCSGVMVMGTLESEQTHQDGSLEVHHQVLAVWPPLPLVDVPLGAPPEIAEDAEGVGACLWMDPDGSAVRLRRIAEVLFPKEHKSRVNLHQRIEAAATDEEAATLAHGIRVLGNTGAHDGEVKFSDVIAGAEMLSHLLHRIYPPLPSISGRRAVDAARQWKNAESRRRKKADNTD